MSGSPNTDSVRDERTTRDDAEPPVRNMQHSSDMVERVARAIDGELPVLETSETLKAAAFAALKASCHAELRNMIERLLGRMGIDSCGYDAKLYAQVEDLLAKIGGAS